jgi:hypothetical protein
MNLAILIGVSDYSNEKIPNLTACNFDVNLMNSLLKSTKKYEEILLIEKDTTSENVKKQLTEFIKKHTADKEKVIEEVFFYYSGHGQVYNDEFYYILSNFDFDQRNSTSLNNSELDNLLRNLNSKLAIKIIDACQSGISYVKEPGDFKIEKIVNNEKQTFQNCYFMFSSHSDQSSLATDKISHFTNSFLKAITQSKNGEIRYADIINHIKDDFAQPHSQQTPFFIIQADYTETFCNNNDTLRTSLLDKLSTLPSLKIEKTNSSVTLLEIIKKEAEEYCKTPEEAYELLKQVHEIILSYNFNEELINLYDITFTDTDDYSNLPKVNIIGKQLSKEDDYFVELKYRAVKFREEIKNNWSSFLKVTSQINGTEPEKQYRIVEKELVSEIFVTEKSPFYRINIDFEPKLPNLPGFNSTLVAAFSKRELTIFYFYNKCKEIGWNEFVKNEVNVIWKYNKFPLKKVAETEEKKKLEKIFQDFEKYILDYLSEKYKSQLTENNPMGVEMLVPIVTN